MRVLKPKMANNTDKCRYFLPKLTNNTDHMHTDKFRQLFGPLAKDCSFTQEFQW